MFLIVGLFILQAFGNRIIKDAIKYKFNLPIVPGKPILKIPKNNNNI